MERMTLPLIVAAAHAYYLYTVWQSVKGQADPFAEFPLTTPVALTLGYLAMVFVGPKLMGDSAAWDLSETMFVYNWYQTGLNAWIVGAFIWEVYSTGSPVWGMGVDRSAAGTWLGFIIYVHYNNKFIEFLDSLFMILRQKRAQLSFLHVYHHCLMPWAWFAVVHYACGGDAYFGAMMNSFIHVVMYSYYALSSRGVRVPWKKQVTNLQLIQFVICATHSIAIWWWGEAVYPPYLSLLELYVMTTMLILFGRFYAKAYGGKKKQGEGKDGKKEK
jgi:elongation of very long chain fatty acids protein 4